MFSLGTGACVCFIDMVLDPCVSLPAQAFCDDAVGLKFNPVLYPKVSSLCACGAVVHSSLTWHGSGTPWEGSSLYRGGVMWDLYDGLLCLPRFLLIHPQTGTWEPYPAISGLPALLSRSLACCEGWWRRVATLKFLPLTRCTSLRPVLGLGTFCLFLGSQSS